MNDTIKKRLIKIGISLSFIIISICIYGLYIDEGNNIPEHEFLGKTKREVITLILKKGRPSDYLEFVIRYKKENINGYYNAIFKTNQEALNHSCLMDSNNWTVDIRQKFQISIFCKNSAIKLKFKNDKVYMSKKITWESL